MRRIGIEESEKERFLFEFILFILELRIEKIVEEFNNVIFISDDFLLSDVYSELIIIKLFKFSISKRLSKKLYFLNLIIILR